MSEPIIKNGKGSLGVDNVASINAKRTIAISSTASEKDNEPVNKELSWAKLADFYSRPMVGDKGGKAMMPFTMNGIRAIERAIQSDLLSIDVDCGAPFDDVVASAVKLGFECFIHTTFSNMTETTEIAAKRVEAVGIVECLAAKYLPAIYLNEQTGESVCEVVGEVERTRTTTVQGKRVTTTSSYQVVHHKPVPKMRLVFLLAKPFVAKHYGPAAENTWREMYHAMAEQLGVKADGSAADLARLFFTPRVPDEAAVEHFAFAYLPGKPVRVSDLIDPKAMKSIDARQHGPTTTAIIQERIAQRVFYEPSGSIQSDVKRWLGINKPDLRGVIMGADSAWPILKTDATKLHLQCPFMDDHSNEQLEGDTSFSLLSEGALHCYHDGCNGRERLDFLSRAFELGWLDTGLLAVDTGIASVDVGSSVTKSATTSEPQSLTGRMLDTFDAENMAQTIYGRESFAGVTPVDIFAERPAPTFPIDTLPSQLGLYAKQLSNQSGFDVGAYAFSMLVMASAVIDSRTRLNVGPFKSPAHLWGGLAGPSGAGKSPVHKSVTDLANGVEQRRVEASREALAEWSAAIAGVPKKDHPPKPPWKQRQISDATIEALVRQAEDCSSGMIMATEEITQFIGNLDAYRSNAGKDRSVMLRAYDGGSETVHRMTGDPRHIENLSIAILAGVQPEVWAKNLSDGKAADGLFQRFMIYQMQPAKGVDYTAKIEFGLRGSCESLFELIEERSIDRGPLTLSIDDDAQKLMNDFHNQMRVIVRGLPSGRFAEHCDKHPGFLARVALTLQLMWAAANGGTPESVTAATMNHAISVMNVMYRHSEAVYETLEGGESDYVRLAKSAAEAILSKQWNDFTRGDLTRNATGWQGADFKVAEGAINLLIECGWIRDVTARSAAGVGRKSQGKFVVHQSVHAMFLGHSERITAMRAERYAAITEKLGDVDAN